MQTNMQLALSIPTYSKINRLIIRLVQASCKVATTSGKQRVFKSNVPLAKLSKTSKARTESAWPATKLLISLDVKTENHKQWDICGCSRFVDNIIT